MSQTTTWVNGPPGGQPGATTAGMAGLASAVAGIVSVAAQRALAAGDLPALREAIERALDTVAGTPATDPRDAVNPEVPHIADAEPAREREQLLALSQQQGF